MCHIGKKIKAEIKSLKYASEFKKQGDKKLEV